MSAFHHPVRRAGTYRAGVYAARSAACAFLCALALWPAGAQSPAAPVSRQTQKQLHGLDPTLRDTSVDPCVDFYQYACGGWLRQNPIPPDQSSYGIDTDLSEKNRLVLRGILERASAATAGRTPDQQKIGDYYASCMDTAAVNRDSLNRLKPLLDQIDGLTAKDQLPPLIAALQRAGAPVLFRFSAEQDAGDATQEIAVFDQARLGLPERGYYLRTDPKSVALRKQYTDHIARMFVLLGEPSSQAAKDAQTVLGLETRLAQVSISNVDRRQPRNIYHKIPLSTFVSDNRQFAIPVFLRSSGAPNLSMLNVAVPGYFAGLNALLSQTDPAALRVLLRWDLLNGTPGVALPQALDDETFHFYGQTLSGQPQQQPRWKRCVRATDGALGEALGKAYVEQRFSPEDKARNLEIARNIEAAMGRDLTTLSWMSEPTKVQAQKKLAAITNNIGYPDRWRDYSKLEIVRGDALGNAQRAAAFERARHLAKIGKPVDKTEWEMSPPTVNAYYNPQMNSVNFPAGILQPPYYDPAMDDAVNYGQGGGLEGHELTHGFDDEGRQFDANGNLKDWWTAEDNKRFDQRADCVVKEYDGFTAVDTLHVNGRLTLGENIADLGGLKLGYLAWESLQNQPGAAKEPDLAGMSPAQQFFVAYAQSWCQNNRPEELRLRVQTDPHSPEEFRVNGVVENLPQFQQAFGCKAGQPMVAANRCEIW
jgi:putative endopeptidase